MVIKLLLRKIYDMEMSFHCLDLLGLLTLLRSKLLVWSRLTMYVVEWVWLFYCATSHVNEYLTMNNWSSLVFIQLNNKSRTVICLCLLALSLPLKHTILHPKTHLVQLHHWNKPLCHKSAYDDVWSDAFIIVLHGMRMNIVDWVWYVWITNIINGSYTPNSSLLSFVCSVQSSPQTSSCSSVT